MVAIEIYAGCTFGYVHVDCKCWEVWTAGMERGAGRSWTCDSDRLRGHGLSLQFSPNEPSCSPYCPSPSMQITLEDLPCYHPWLRYSGKHSSWSQLAWLPWETGRLRTVRWSAVRTCWTTGYLATYIHTDFFLEGFSHWDLMYNSQQHKLHKTKQDMMVCTAQLNWVVLCLIHQYY